MGNDSDPNSAHEELVESLKRDICYFYDGLAEYPYVHGDIPAMGLIQLPPAIVVTTEFADGLDPTTARFVISGSLVMLYGVLFEVAGGSMSHFGLTDEYLDDWTLRLSAVVPQEDSFRNLVAGVDELIRRYRGNQFDDLRATVSRARAIHRDFVQRYFTEKAEQVRRVHGA